MPSVCDWITVLRCLFQYVRLESNVFVVLRDAADQESEAGDPRHAVELYETLADDLGGSPAAAPGRHTFARPGTACAYRCKSTYVRAMS